MKKFILLTFIASLLQGCAFDAPEIHQHITGRFYLYQMLGNDEIVSLVQQDGEYTYRYLIEYCEVVIFDRKNKVIYAKEAEKYEPYHVYELDGLGKYDYFKEKKVTEKEFNKLLANCKDCIKVYKLGQGRIKDDIE
ncbi:hypothetical protein FUA48_11265 [Flavobacterium alkalisoli]|uniref:Lipoprotein n=1 Tax=Flavobacterium alkalisoli TaxID=2602769 RepID=A0A5B9FV24_9FLAO|nr:hypothetical protein [Flavobacterium alkalisoli]QEE50139.1 hypothetical protein FUA48_11265 [Flavobacterium alkalisoli]